MSKAEKAALKAYPPTYSRRKRYAKRVQSELVDTHQSVRALFQKGYEQAKKDTIERACEWMEKNIRLPHPRKGTDECIVNLNAFKEAMEEE